MHIGGGLGRPFVAHPGIPVPQRQVLLPRAEQLIERSGAAESRGFPNGKNKGVVVPLSVPSTQVQGIPGFEIVIMAILVWGP